MASDDEQPRGGGLGDLFAQFEQAQEIIQGAAAEASATIVEGSAADGRIVVQLSGDLEAVAVHIDPSVVDPGDVSMLEDLVLAAIRDGLAQIVELQEGVTGAFSAPGGLDLGALLGSLGNLSGLGGVPGLADLPGLGNLGSFDIGAMAQLPGLEGLAGLAGESGRPGASPDDDEDDAARGGTSDAGEGADDDEAGRPGPG